jgi:hypothetical protein
MNREIKFRFFVPGHGMSRAFTLQEIWLNKEFKTKSGTNISFYDTTLIVMQYIGLKDRYEYEIYEGDVLANDLDKEGNMIRNPCAFQISRYLHKSNEFSDFKVVYGWNIIFSGIERSKIIGNIYQNPELLEDDFILPESPPEFTEFEQKKLIQLLQEYK